MEFASIGTVRAEVDARLVATKWEPRNSSA
jgi:hypothetical protein